MIERHYGCLLDRAGAVSRAARMPSRPPKSRPETRFGPLAGQVTGVPVAAGTRFSLQIA
jgi:hypothetical protein